MLHARFVNLNYSEDTMCYYLAAGKPETVFNSKSVHLYSKEAPKKTALSLVYYSITLQDTKYMLNKTKRSKLTILVHDQTSVLTMSQSRINSPLTCTLTSLCLQESTCTSSLCLGVCLVLVLHAYSGYHEYVWHIQYSNENINRTRFLGVALGRPT